MAAKRLSGQAALVTGAAKNIGREIALTLAADGANLVINGKRTGPPPRRSLPRLRPMAAPPSCTWPTSPTRTLPRG